jgi:hypothetical protein
LLLGTPGQQRLIQFDERRISDLQQITFAIDSYWQQNKRLPESLENLHDGRYYYVESISDPKTGDVYEYLVIDAERYELCAVFETTATEQEKQRGVPKAFSEQIWDHDIGRGCFNLEVRKPVQGEPILIPAR